MNDGIKIRSARRGDREGIAALLKELGYPDACDSNTLSWVLSHPEIDVFVAVDALDRAVGVLTLSHRPQLRLRGRIATIDELVVAEAWRGKNVGTRLLQHGIARAKALSVKRLELTTHRGRESYRRSFYEKAGFVLVDSAVLRLGEFERK
ncbi:MAG: GNAT family N-acetyltransferase [Myxococcales bacterium]